MLEFHIFLIFNCEELVRIRAICEGLVRIFFRDEKLVLNFHKCEESVPNAHRCEKSNQLFADVKKKFTNIDIEKLVTPPGGHILKQSNNLNNIGRGCPTDHLCLILLKSDQKFLTRF